MHTLYDVATRVKHTTYVLRVYGRGKVGVTVVPTVVGLLTQSLKREGSKKGKALNTTCTFHEVKISVSGQNPWFDFWESKKSVDKSMPS